MCGIFGIKNSQVNLNKIKEQMYHRGPDAFGSKQVDKWTFCHARLSILDLSDAGMQPMELNGCYLCFNGEIYNYKELCEEFLDNVELKSSSDTEVLLHLLYKYGIKILNKLNGMFAFAYYDTRDRKTYLVRDRYGVKPLYYYKNDQVFAFASEDVTLINTLNIPYEFNNDYKQLLIENTISDNSEITPIKNVFQVPAGNYLTISDSNQISLTKWYNFDDSEEEYNFRKKDEVIEIFENILTDAIKIRNRSDVTVGITLSGGLDSSIIYTLSKEKLDTNYKIFTYANAINELDETSKAKRLALEYGDSITTISQQEETMDTFLKSLLHLNAPIWAPSHTGYYNLYSAIKEQNIKVILEGHGADELLGGWPWTLTPAIQQAFKSWHPILSYEIFKTQQKTWNKGLAQNFNYNFINYIKILAKTKFRKNSFSELLDNLFSYSVLPINLRCWDRLSMANSIESRSPFLDYRVVEFCKKLPLKYKVNNLGNKAILREILLKYKKDYIVDNKIKQGYLSSEVNFLNKYSEELLKFYNKNQYNYDISSWENKMLDYSYNTKIYRIIAFNILYQHYNRNKAQIGMVVERESNVSI